MAPGWWFALLSLLYVRKEIDLAALPMSFAALLMWSPLAMMGAAPLLALFPAGTACRAALVAARRSSPRSASRCVSCRSPLYLTIDAATCRMSVLLCARRLLLTNYLLLPRGRDSAGGDRALRLEQGRALPTVASSRSRSACCFVIPFYSVGVSNDFVMRVSIPPLFLLAFAFARIAVLTPRDDSRFATAISVIVILLRRDAASRDQTGAAAELRDQRLQHAHELAQGRSFRVCRRIIWARIEKIPGWLMRPQSGDGADARRPQVLARPSLPARMKHEMICAQRPGQALRF